MARNRVTLTDGLGPAVTKARTPKTDEDTTPAKTAPEVPAAPKERTQQDTTKRQERSALDERVNLGVYLSADTYDDMKAAYLADWTNRRGEADTLYRWVADALSAHAGRSVAQRGSAPATAKRAATRTGNTRAFKIPSDVYARMQDAIAADERSGRWSSESAWSVEALVLAIEAARDANNGTLPEPPARLPNRLKRRD